jgi:hypothetical protein
MPAICRTEIIAGTASPSAFGLLRVDDPHPETKVRRCLLSCQLASRSGDNTILGSSTITSCPLLFFDTNVCDDFMREPYADRYLQIRDKIGKRFRMVVSAETFIELLRTLKGGDGSHFPIDKKRLQIAAGSENPSFLSFPGEFVFYTSLNLSVPAKFGPQDFGRWFRVIMTAQTRSELFTGTVRIGNMKFGIDPGIMKTSRTKE